MNEIKPVNIDFFSEFDEKACTRCGQCFHNCPIMHLPLDKSIQEINRLINSEKTEIVLKKCQSCFSCNFYCPENARPASLILKRWYEQYQKEGLKKRGEYFMTLYPHYPNFRTHVMDKLPENMKELVKKWAVLTPLKGDTLTYPGCNIITFPELTQLSIFQDLDIRGRLEYCCGETLFRTGYVDKLFQITKRLNKWFNMLKPKNLLVMCTAGTNVFKNVLPHYGLTYKFDSIKSYIQYIWEKIDRGEVNVKEKLDMKVTIQESCYAKMFGDEYMDLPRKILNHLGIEVIETKACREDMRCCGIGSGFSMDSAYYPLSLIQSGMRNLRDFKETKADAICVYCAGCLATLTTVQKLIMGKKMKIFHINELIQKAMGEEPSLTEKAKKQRASHFFWGIIKKQMPKLLSLKKIKIADIPEDPPSYDIAY
ncbi:MAG: (Fe-S)-binding protein [Promethearchaeota archaeon]